MSTAARFLRGFIGMRIIDVRDNAGGVVIEVGPVGHRSRRRLLLIQVAGAEEIVTAAGEPDAPDDDDGGLGDELYDRSRYDDKEAP